MSNGKKRPLNYSLSTVHKKKTNKQKTLNTLIHQSQQMVEIVHLSIWQLL